MSELYASSERVLRMPPLSVATLERLAEALLLELAPEALTSPCSLDVLRLIDDELPKWGIHIYPATSAELGASEGLTSPEGSKDIEIIVAADQWHDLEDGGPVANRARATVMHETGHAVLHVPVIRRRQQSAETRGLRRVQRSALKPYLDPEWQAWTLAGCILMPRKTLRTISHLDPRIVASTYGVSPAFAVNHMRRLHIIR